MSQPSILYKQPVLRPLYWTYAAATIAARLPLWLAQASVPSLRPRRDWTFKQTVLTRVLLPFLLTQCEIGVTETLSLEPGAEGDRWVVIDPFEDTLYTGLLVHERVRPAKMGGTWFPAKPDGVPGKVVMWIHGGAFVIGAGRTDFMGPGANMLLSTGGVDAVFSPQYRLAGYEGMNPFPAALQDCLTSYLYLVRTLEIPAANIVLMGDSAGGNLVIALLRYLVALGTRLSIPEPRSAVLVSPWVDPASPDGFDGHRSRRLDYIPQTLLDWGAAAYAGEMTREAARGDAYVTPLRHPFATRVPLFVTAGTAEVFEDAVWRWAGEMDAVEGNVVEVNAEEGAPHDTPLMAHMMGFEESARGVIGKVGEFVAKHHAS